MKWFDILPYKAEGIKALLDHVGRFVIVVYREDGGRIGICIAAKDRTTISMLDGMEVVVRKPFEFDSYERYRRYKHKRHCAIPIASKESDVESIYGILDREVLERACLCVNVMKTASMSRIYSYIRCLENNQPSEGVGRVFGMFAAPSKNKISAIRQGRIQMAKSKIAQCTHLFSCEIICGASRTDDIRSIESIFPYDAFTYNTISCKKARRAMVHRPSLPIFGKTRHPLLSETELTSFVNLPTENDLLRTGLKHGKTTSYTSGSRLPRMDNTVNDD